MKVSIERDQRILSYVHSDVLQPKEQLIWKGRPSPTRSMAVAALKTIFGVFFFCGAVVMTVIANQHGMALFGVPLLLGGLWLVTVPVRLAMRARKTYYAITDKRVLIVKAGKRIKVITITSGDITDYERSDRGDGTGDIRLHRVAKKGPQVGSILVAEFEDGLWGVDDVKGAADAIAALRLTNGE